MKKLLIISKSIDGGTGTFTLQLLEIGRLFKDKYEVEVLCMERPSLRSITENQKIRYIHTKNYYPNKHTLHNSIIYFFIDLRNVYLYVKNTTPDVIIAVNYYSNILISILRIFRLANTKIVLTHHNNIRAILEKKCSTIMRYLLQIGIPLLFNQSLNIVVSKYLSFDLARSLKIKNMKVIFNGVKLNNINEKKIKKHRNIISIGRFDGQKDFFTLLRAFGDVNRKIKDTRLIIMGDGRDRKKMVSYIFKNRLNEVVRVIKWQTNINKYLSSSTIFVLSSFYEGFSYATIEAMSNGIPVIATDSPYGPREILKNGRYGILVPIKDEKKMNDAICLLLTDPKKYLYFSNQSLKRAEYFNLDKMISSYKTLIDSLFEVDLK